MTKRTIKELRDDARALFNEYGARFAGKPRATRDLDELDSIIDRLDALIEEGRSQQNGGRDPALQSILEQAIENLEIYEKERERIAAVQAGGDVIVEGSALASWANLIFGQYYRHFAGKPRATRDLGLLSEILAELEFVEERMAQLIADDEAAESLADDLETVRSNKETYEEELARIAEARSSGSLEDQASYLAVAANEQFTVYRDHFGGKPRVSRRPELLERVIVTLESIQGSMKELKRRGLQSEQNDNNIQTVAQQLSTYRDELNKIQQAKQGTAPDELVGNLGAAANSVMEEYRANYAGQDRATRDLELLTRLCDEMLDIARQMRSLRAQIDSEANERNLTIVLDNLLLYQQEWEEIEKAQQEA
ncbi:MAG: hypothetical protein ACQEVA_14310 [Myxococcota bacterium]